MNRDQGPVGQYPDGGEREEKIFAEVIDIALNGEGI